MSKSVEIKIQKDSAVAVRKLVNSKVSACRWVLENADEAKTKEKAAASLKTLAPALNAIDKSLEE